MFSYFLLLWLRWSRLSSWQSFNGNSNANGCRGDAESLLKFIFILRFSRQRLLLRNESNSSQATLKFSLLLPVYGSLLRMENIWKTLNSFFKLLWYMHNNFSSIFFCRKRNQTIPETKLFICLSFSLNEIVFSVITWKRSILNSIKVLFLNRMIDSSWWIVFHMVGEFYFTQNWMKKGHHKKGKKQSRKKSIFFSLQK